MAPTKLSDDDKQTILKLYRQPEETTSTLAERYGVSNSTISRLLKATLPEAEYSALIQQKRAAASGDKAASAGPVSVPAAKETADPPADSSPEPATGKSETPRPAKPITKAAKAALETAPSTEADPAVPSPDSPEEPPVSSGRPMPVPRRRTTASSDPEDGQQLPLLDTDTATGAGDPGSGPQPAPADAIAADDLQVAEDEDFDDDDDDDDFDDDDDDFDDDEAGGDWRPPAHRAHGHEHVHIIPLTEAVLPQLCYVVVERTSGDLVTCPLKDFSDLGQIPEAEVDSVTLPIFDNHRVARRFTRRNQRVIKVPDGNLLQTTRSYLQAKGIARLLIDGQVYTLEDEEDPAVVTSE